MADDDARLRHRLRFDSVDHATRHLRRTPQAIRRRARTLGLAASCRPESRRSGTRWTAVEDDPLGLHPGLNPAVLGALLERSDHAIAARLRHLGLRAGRWRSPPHPSLRTAMAW